MKPFIISAHRPGTNKMFWISGMLKYSPHGTFIDCVSNISESEGSKRRAHSGTGIGTPQGHWFPPHWTNKWFSSRHLTGLTSWLRLTKLFFSLSAKTFRASLSSRRAWWNSSSGMAGDGKEKLGVQSRSKVMASIVSFKLLNRWPHCRTLSSVTLRLSPIKIFCSLFQRFFSVSNLI